MSRLTKIVSIHNNEPEFYEANIDLYPKMMGYEHQQAEMDCIHKLGKLEDLEEELGCPLEVVIEALKGEKILFENEEYYGSLRWNFYTEGFVFDLNTNKEITNFYLRTNDYGKTWFLKGEKNE